MNKWKRLLSVLLSLSMMLSWNVPAMAAEGENQDVEKTYEYTEETCPNRSQHNNVDKMEVLEVFEEATCTTPGQGQYGCGLCGYVDWENEANWNRPIPALGHDLIKVVEDASCTVAGKEYQKCQRDGCDYRTEGTTIPATGSHSWTTEDVEISEATCTEPKKVGKKCTNDGCTETMDVKTEGTALGHVYTGGKFEVLTEATCTTKGEKVKVCDRCNAQSEDAADKEEIGVDSANHGDYGTTRADEAKTAATCSSYAVYEMKCDGCQAVVSEVNDEEAGYDADNHPQDRVETSTKEPTCSEGGYTYDYCEACQAEFNKSNETAADATKHVYDKTKDRVVVVPGTCQKPDQLGYLCTVCQKADSYDKKDLQDGDESTKDPDNHVWGKETVTPATCTENAKSTKTCTVCDPATVASAKVVTDLWLDVPEADRDENNKAHHTWVDVAEKAPTCGEGGHGAGKQCSVCKEWEGGSAPSPTQPDPSKHVPDEDHVTISREATCTKTGLERNVCTVCGKSYYVTIPAGHKFPEAGQGKVILAATCLRKGSEEVTCERYKTDADGNLAADNACNKAEGRTITRDIPQLNHDYEQKTDDSAYKAATCAEDGLNVEVCKMCGDRKETVLPATGAHSYARKTTKACGDAQPMTGSYCSVCEQLEPDTTETPMQSSDSNYGTYHQNAHTYVADTEASKAATCTEDGVDAKVCSFCGDKTSQPIPAGHKFATGGSASGDASGITYTPHQEDCTVAGYYTKHCTVCNEDIQVTEASEITAAQSATGVDVSAKAEHANIEESEEVPATCQKDGVEAGSKCTTCGKVISGLNKIPASADYHAFDEGVITREPTCTKNGMKKQTCNLCGNVKYTVMTAEHDFENGTLVESKSTEATCLEDGVEVKKCANCDVESDPVVVAALGHDYENGTVITEESVEATCTADGKTVTKCARCDVKETKTLDATGHDFENGTEVAEESVAATCGKAGKNVKTCANNCGEKQATVEPKKDTHTGATLAGLIPANCAHPTQVAVYCEDCNEAVNGTDGNPLKLDYTTTTTEAEVLEFYHTNAAQTGWGETNDSNDTTKVTDNDIKALIATWTAADQTEDHEWIDVVKETATCFAPGVKDRTCAVCATEEENVVIPQREHNLVENPDKMVDASCANGGTRGYMVLECEQPGCNYSEQADLGIDPPPHDEVETIIREATCTKNGYAKYVCSVCQEERYDTVLAAHKWGEPSYDEAAGGKAPTCTETGTAIYTCQNADCPDKTKTETVEATGHTFGPTAFIPANCTEPARVGKTCTVATCKHVEAVEITAESDIEALLKAIQADMDDPSQIESQRPTLEAAIKNPGATGHSWGDDENPTGDKDPSSVAATCQSTGKDIYVCKNSGCTADPLEITLAKLPHNWTEEYIDPTCTVAGHIHKTCQNVNNGVACDAVEDVPVEGDDVVPHNYSIKVKTPAVEGGSICEVGGTLTETCSTCPQDDPENPPASRTSEIKPGHEWKLTRIMDPDTKKLMAIIRSCQNCDYKEPKPSYTATGYVYCQDCADIEGIGINGVQKLGEDDVEAGTPATCETDGTTDLKKCPNCKKVVQDHEVIPALGHADAETLEWTVTTAATCGKDGKKEKLCPKCGKSLASEAIAATGEHKEYVEDVQPATCQTPELLVMVCKVCGELKEDFDPIELNPADPTLHVFGEDGTCQNEGCDATVPDTMKYCAEHKWVTPAVIEAVEADCTTEGSSEGSKCPEKDCTTVFVAPTITTPLGHDFVEDATTETPATCLKPAQVGKKCSRCSIADPNGPYDKEGSEVDVYAHNFGADDVCTICNKNAAEFTDPDAEGYLELLAKCATDGWVKGVKVDGTPSTCNQLGTADGVKCPTCETIIKGGEPLTEYADHTWTDKWVLDTENMPTCTTDGQKFKQCDVCNEKFGDAEIAEKSDEYHEYVEEIIPATCVKGDQVAELCKYCKQLDPNSVPFEDGDPDPYAHDFNEEGVCQREGCGKNVTDLTNPEHEDYLERLGKCESHGWVEGLEAVSAKAPTCAEPGYTASYKCPVCAEDGTTTIVIESKDLEKLTTHTPGEEFNVEKEATCQETGIKYVKCSVCGENVGEAITIEMLAHDYVEFNQEATCTQPGRVGFFCSMCGKANGEVLEDPIDPDNHGDNIVDVAEIQATCTTPGKTAGKKCSECGVYTDGGLEIPAPGHTPGEYRTVTESTCETAGSEIQTCSVCGEDIEGTDRELALLPHTLGEYHTVKASTCKTKGSEIQTCSACEKDIEETRRELELDADNHEKVVTVPGTPATCTETGLSDGEKCEACDVVVTEQTELAALGHKFGEDDVCTECGKKRASATTVGSGSIIGGNKKITLSTYVEVADEEAEILETGMLYINAAGYDPANVEADLSVELDANGTFTASGNLRNRKFTKEMAEAEGKTMRDYLGMTMTLNLGSAESTVNDERMVYARGYVITLKDGVYTITYSSNIISGNYANGFK